MYRNLTCFFALALAAVLLAGCPSRKPKEPTIDGLSNGGFDGSLRRFQATLPPERWDHFARALLFLHLDDPLLARTTPAQLADLLEYEFSADFRIQLNHFTAEDLTRYARGRFLGLVRQYQQTLAQLDTQITARSDEIAAARDSQAILRDIVIAPEHVRLERIPGVSVVRAVLRFDNRTGRPLSAALLRTRVQLPGGGYAEDTSSITFNPVLTVGEVRDIDRILSQSIVPDLLNPALLSFEIINAYDQRQSPLARVLDPGATDALAKLRTERAEIEALLAQIGRPDDHPYLRLQPSS